MPHDIPVGPLYDKNIVDALSGYDSDNLRTIIGQVGGYVVSRIGDAHDKLALIEILSDTDTPVAEIKKIYTLLGIDHSSGRSETYTIDEMESLGL